MDEKTCKTCNWHGAWLNKCHNPDSPRSQDVTAWDESCAGWQEIPPENHHYLRKVVEEQLG